MLAEDLDDVPGELVRLVDLGRARRDPLPRERAHELADLALLLGEDVPGHGRSLVECPLGDAVLARARRACSNAASQVGCRDSDVPR